MPGFETIVRPVVFPNIRPTPTRSRPPADDPEQGKCIIGGGGGGVIAVTESVSTNGTLHNPKETQRRVDVMRVYQKEDDGTINKENFVDLQVADRIKMKVNVQGDDFVRPGPKMFGGGTGGVPGDDEVFTTPGPKVSATVINAYNYRKSIESRNVKILQRAKIIHEDWDNLEEIGGEEL